MITIVSGTHRPNSFSLKIAKAYAFLLEKMGQECQILNLEDLPRDFIWADMFGEKSNEGEELIRKFIDGAQKMIFIVPEYNGSYPGITKVFLDALDPSKMNAKRVALTGIASGSFGNQRGLDDLTMVMHHLKVDVIPHKVLIPAVYNSLNEKGDFNNQRLLERVEDQIERLLK